MKWTATILTVLLVNSSCARERFAGRSGLGKGSEQGGPEAAVERVSENSAKQETHDLVNRTDKKDTILTPNPLNPTREPWTISLSGMTGWGWSVFKAQSTTGASPNSRYGVAAAFDAKNKVLYTFGGNGASDPSVYYNDLWKFEFATKTWTAISVPTDLQGSYGSRGASSPQNHPPARVWASAWVTGDGAFWLFAGHGRRAVDNMTLHFNDLWRYGPDANGVWGWAWISGAKGESDLRQCFRSSGLGSYDSQNTPGSRVIANTAIDNQGDVILFSGANVGTENCAQVGSSNPTNDLWKFNSTTRQWAKLSNGTTSAYARYVESTEGLPHPGNIFQGGGIVAADNFTYFHSGVHNGTNSSNGGVTDHVWQLNSSANWRVVSGSPPVAPMPSCDGTGQYNTSNSPGGGYNPILWTDSQSHVRILAYRNTFSGGAIGGHKYVYDLDPSSGKWACIVYAGGGYPGADYLYASWTTGGSVYAYDSHIGILRFGPL